MNAVKVQVWAHADLTHHHHRHHRHRAHHRDRGHHHDHECSQSQSLGACRPSTA